MGLWDQDKRGGRNRVAALLKGKREIGLRRVIIGGEGRCIVCSRFCFFQNEHQGSVTGCSIRAGERCLYYRFASRGERRGTAADGGGGFKVGKKTGFALPTGGGGGRKKKKRARTGARCCFLNREGKRHARGSCISWEGKSFARGGPCGGPEPPRNLGRKREKAGVDVLPQRKGKKPP